MNTFHYDHLWWTVFCHHHQGCNDWLVTRHDLKDWKSVFSTCFRSNCLKIKHNCSSYNCACAWPDLILIPPSISLFCCLLSQQHYISGQKLLCGCYHYKEYWVLFSLSHWIQFSGLSALAKPYPNTFQHKYAVNLDDIGQLGDFGDQLFSMTEWIFVKDVINILYYPWKFLFSKNQFPSSREMCVQIHHAIQITLLDGTYWTLFCKISSNTVLLISDL